MQLPGRLLLTNARIAPSPVPLLLASFALQIAGLAALMVHGTVAMWTGVIVFAAGRGSDDAGAAVSGAASIRTGAAGYANGVIARGQQLARAAGPVAAAAAGSALGYNAVFASLAVLLVAAMLLTRGEGNRLCSSRGSPRRR